MKNAMNEKGALTEFLESAGAATLEVRRLQRRLDSLGRRRSALRIKRGATARKLAKMIEDERWRELELVREELEKYRRVEAFIASVPDLRCRMILRRRYLEPEASWTEVRDRLEEDGVCYSQRHLVRLHAQALEEARKLWDTEGEGGEIGKRR